MEVEDGEVGASDRRGVPNENDLAVANDASEVDNEGGGAGDVGAAASGAASRGQGKSSAW